MNTYGPIGRLGRWAATHRRPVFAIWAILTIVLGLFAPRVEHALSGAGWEATGSESVEARQIIDREFNGLSSSSLMVVVRAKQGKVNDPAVQRTIAKVSAILDKADHVTTVVPPQPGMSISRDGRVAVVQAGADGTSNDMVRVADDIKEELSQLSSTAAQVNLTGASGMWSDFNEANRAAMMKSEVMSWPVTMVILLFAFGSLVAAGLPLMLTILGLMTSAGVLYLVTQITDVSIWAMNFALMFALALGIDYALFIVHRFRGALLGSELPVVDAVATTMETAGKAVLFSGLTVLISLSAVMLVPSPAFRSMSLGIMISVLFILLATLTLLPAVLGKLGPKVDKLALPWVHAGEHRSARFAAWGERLWKQPFRFGLPALAALIALSIPVLHLDTGMPSIKVVPEEDGSRIAYNQIQAAFGDGAPGQLQIIAPKAAASETAKVLAGDRGIAAVMPPMSGSGSHVMLGAMPVVDPSSPQLGEMVDRLRGALPAGVLVGGASVENHDLETLLTEKTPLVIGVVLALGFLLLLVALQSPVVALLGVITNLLAVGAAFGVAKWVFQDGKGADLLGLEPQGFLDAWGPVFFFAMIFAISMDYTVFLLSSAKEHSDRSGDPKEAMVGGMAHSGRVIFAAAGVMVAVFFTFALSGPLPPKEMGIILGVAVLLDAALVRLLLLPVLLRLTGRWAWWLPRPLAKVLPKVEFGH